jgi:hypothetical protein
LILQNGEVVVGVQIFDLDPGIEMTSSVAGMKLKLLNHY